MNRRLFRGVLLWAAYLIDDRCAEVEANSAWLAWAEVNQKDRRKAKAYGQMIKRLVP